MDLQKLSTRVGVGITVASGIAFVGGLVGTGIAWQGHWVHTISPLTGSLIFSANMVGLCAAATIAGFGIKAIWDKKQLTKGWLPPLGEVDDGL